jgi:hypothetical protein
MLVRGSKPNDAASAFAIYMMHDANLLGFLSQVGRIHVQGVGPKLARAIGEAQLSECIVQVCSYLDIVAVVPELARYRGVAPCAQSLVIGLRVEVDDMEGYTAGLSLLNPKAPSHHIYFHFKQFAVFETMAPYCVTPYYLTPSSNTSNLFAHVERAIYKLSL